MKKRIASLLLAVCMVVSMLPLNVFASDTEPVYVETLTLPVIAEGEEMPEPQGYGGGISLFSLTPNNPSYAYAYEGVSRATLRPASSKFTFSVAEGVTPTEGGVLQIVDSGGKVLAGSPTIDYYENSSDAGQWYFYSVTFNDESADADHKFANIPAGEYDLQVAVAEERYTVDQKLCVVDSGSLLIKNVNADLYYDTQTAEVYMEVYGLKSDAELANMSLTLADAEGTTIASSTGAFRNFSHNEYYGYWSFRMELAVEEGQQLQSSTPYTLTLADTSERILVDGAGAVTEYPYDHNMQMEDAYFTDAQSGILGVQFLYPDEETVYNVLIADDYNQTTVYGEWSGVIPEDGLVTIPLTLNGMEVSADNYPNYFYVHWKISDYDYWSRDQVTNPYANTSTVDANFYPNSMDVDVTEQTFRLELYNFDSFMGDGTDVLTMCDSKGNEVASCTVFEEDWTGSSWTYLYGTLNITETLTKNQRYYLFLNGIEIDNVYVRDDLYYSRDWNYTSYNSSDDTYTMWTNFGEFPISAETLNSSGTARFELRDAEGNVRVTTGNMTKSASEFTGYVHYDGVFKQEDLTAYAGEALYLYYIDGDYENYNNDRPLIYDATVSEVIFYNEETYSDDFNVYVNWYRMKVGDTMVIFNIQWDMHNMTEAVLLDRMQDLRLECGETVITVDGMTLNDVDGHTLTLSAPMTAGEWTIYDGDTVIGVRNINAPDDSDTDPSISGVNEDGWYVWGYNLPEDSTYTAKLYQGYTCLTDEAFELTLVVDEDGNQRLRLPKSVVANLARGEYELRVYMDNNLLGNVSFTAEGTLQPTIIVRDEYGRNWSDRIYHGEWMYFQVSGTHAWKYFRAAESEEALATARWYNLDTIYELTDTETIGERTLYIQLSEDEAGTETSDVIVYPFLYLGEEGMVDIYVHEDVDGLYSGDTVTLGLGAEYRHANAMVELVDGDGNVEVVRLSYQGEDVLPDLTAHVVEGGEIIGSEHPYSSNMDETYTYTLEGAESIEVTFSSDTETESNYDKLYVYYVENGEDVLYKEYTGTALAGQTLTLPGDTVKVRLTSDGSAQKYGFSIVSVVDPDAPPVTEDGEPVPTYHIYSTKLNTEDYIGTEKLCFYLVENVDDDYGNRNTLVSEVIERSLIFGDPTSVILPQFNEDYNVNYRLINEDHFSLYGYGIPGSTVTLTYPGDGETAVVLGTATAAANGKFTMELTDLADGSYDLTATSVLDESSVTGTATLEVDTTAPVIEAMGFAFSDSDTATLNWTCKDSDLYRCAVYLVTESGDVRLGYVYPSDGTDGVFSKTVTATNNDGQKFKVVVTDEAGNTATRTISTSDEESPTAPVNLAYTDRTSASVTLTWEAGTDNVGVAGYNIFKNGEKIAQTVGESILSYEVTNLEQGTEYTFSVATRDLADNVSVDPNPELKVSTAKLSVKATIPGTVTTNGYESVDVNVQAALSSDTEEYTPSIENLFVRYQAVGENTEPADGQWIDATLTNLSLDGENGYGMWNVSVPADTVLPMSYFVQVVAVDGEEVAVYSETKTVTLVDGRVTFTVVNGQTGQVIPNANVSVYQDGVLMHSGKANVEGKVLLGLEDGSYSLMATADGYQMRSIPSVTVSADRLEFTVYMNSEDILKVETTVKEMSYDEIVAAGIDPTAAGNQQVYQCTAVLDFAPEVPISYICAGDKVIQGEPIEVGDYVVYPAARDIFLIVPTQTTWLKEMFDVQLLVTNSSEFEDVENCVAELTLPTGLFLAEMSTGIQSTTAEMGTITPGSSATHHWYVRGDAEGDYYLQGVVTGQRTGGGISEDLSVGFTTKDPISVLAGSAMKLTIEAENKATIGQPYNIRFTLKNVSNKSLYNVNFDVLGGTFHQAYTIEEVLASYDLEGPFQPDADNTELKNGFVLSAAEFKPADVLSGVFTITFGEGIEDPDAVEYMLRQVFLFTGAGSTTEIPTEVILVDTVSDHVHTYDDGVVTTEPTCTEAGVKTFTCTDTECGDAFTVEIAALGHNMDEWKVTKAATCLDAGSAESECTNEGCTYTETMVLNALGHDFSEEWTTDVEPTCTEEGSKSHHCTRCGEVTDITVIPANGHSYGEWEKHDAAQHKHTCTVADCGYVEYADHSWDEGEVTTEPTHLAEGVKTFTCTVCGETKTESIDKLTAHEWGNWTKISETEHKRECLCGASETAEHVWGDWTTVTEPTCTGEGTKRRDCEDCDAYETEVIPATGHSWDNGVITKEPSLTEEGVKTYTCTVCDETKTESLAKLLEQEMYFPTALITGQIVMTYGDLNFVAELENESVEDPEVTYSSSNKNVATVDENGWVTIKGAGETTITAVSAGVPYQYVETTASYRLIVNKAELTITANDVEIVYGEVFAPNGYTAEGFVYDETAEVLSGEAAYTCEYAQHDTAGEYDIEVSGFTSNNYDITFVPGKLTVGKTTDYAITFGNLSQKSGNVTAVTTAIDPQDTTAEIKLEYKVGDSWTTELPTEVGTYPVRAQLTSSDNIEVDGMTFGDQLVIEAIDNIGGISVSVKTEEDKATVEVTDEEVAEIVEKLENTNGDLAVNLESVEKDTLVLPGNLVEELNKSENLETVTVTTGNSSIEMSNTVLDTMAEAMEKEDTVSLQMEIKEMDELTEAEQNALESIGGNADNSVVVELKLTVTDADGNVKEEIKELGDKVNITIQCTEEMKNKRLVACYISPDGTVTYLVAKYDEVTNTLNFTTDHFSIYAVIALEENTNMVYVVDENNAEQPAVGAGPQTVGASVTIQAPAAPSGYRFGGWKVVTGTVTLENANAASTTFTMPAEDIVLMATYSKISSGGGMGGAGSSNSMTVEKTSNGTVELSSKKAEEGSTVTITVTPDEGYKLDKLTVVDKNGEELELTKKSATEYTFEMPAGTVKIEATFVEAEAIVENPFIDVADGAYYYDAVLWAVENGITNGATPVTFEPGELCTRAQVVTFLWRAAGCPTPESSEMPFTDVPAGAYYYDAVLWAVENGITNGVSETSFAPNDTVTRGQTVTFLWRAEGSEEAECENIFTDVADGAYYYDAVLWAVENGITNGVSETSFAPADGCTRGQIVTFLYRNFAK